MECDEFDSDSEDEDAFENIVPEADAVDSVGNRINQQSVADLMINAEILLPRGEEVQMAKVLRRSIDTDGNTVGTFNDHPNQNTLIYDVEFPDGAVKQYAANVIAENVLMQVDSNGYNSCLLDKLVLHKRMGNAVSKQNAYVTTKRGVRKLRYPMIVWKFLCEWKDGSSS
jgi:hypothetical protein